MPRVSALRGFVVRHLVHHRGQMTVYLRLLGATRTAAFAAVITVVHAKEHVMLKVLLTHSDLCYLVNP